jgi:hypothetical protein
MPGREFPRTKTAINPADTAALLLDAYPRVHGHVPDRNTAELYLALLWNENNRGKAIYNDNWGNVVALGDQDYYRPVWFYQATIDSVKDPDTRARYQRLRDKMIAEPGTVPTKFRHMQSPEAGAERWIRTLAEAKNPKGENRYAKTRAAARAGDALEFGRQLHFEGYIADPGTDKLGKTYASLREDIRREQYFAHLPLPTEQAPPQTVLLAGNQYRITEATFYQPDWQQLRAEMLAAGAMDFEHWDDGQNRRWSHFGPHVYAFTTPKLVIDVVDPQPICQGATLVNVERIRDSEPPTIRKRNPGGAGFLVALVVAGLAAVILKA